MERRRLRVGLIGLGDIAAKAYLPVLAADAGVEPVLITRDSGRRASLQQAWRVAEGYATIEEALASAAPLDAAFVHAATQAHPGISVRPDRCRDPDLRRQATGTVRTGGGRRRGTCARAAGVSLAVCFNRRFAPAYAEVARMARPRHGRANEEPPRAPG